MSSLQLFSLSARVTGEAAKQDGISLELGDWFFQGIGNDIGAFFDLLGPPISETSNEEGDATRWANILTALPHATLEREFFGWMFNRPAGNYDEHTEMDLRAGGSGSGSSSAPGSPLAKGKLRIIRRRALGDHFLEAQRRQLRLSLFLNPTRFVRHQTVPPLRTLARSPQTWPLGEPNFRMLAQPKRKRTAGESTTADVETSFDGNDNVLIGSKLLSFARPGAWQIHLRRYFEAVERELGAEFRRAASHVTGRTRRAVPREPYYSLRTVETYFEFAAQNPSQLLRRLRPALEALGRNYRTRTYPSGRVEENTDRDALRFLIQLRSGKQLRIYAKTSHRVRFEIVHDVRKPGIAALLHAEDGGHTTHSLDELLGWFPMLAHDAAKTVNEVLSALESTSQIPDDSADTYELLGEIFGTVRNASRAKQILTLLIERGCLRVNREGSDYLPEIRQLRRKHILEDIDGSNRVTARYRAALDILRGQSGMPPLTLAVE